MIDVVKKGKVLGDIVSHFNRGMFLLQEEGTFAPICGTFNRFKTRTLGLEGCRVVTSFRPSHLHPALPSELRNHQGTVTPHQTIPQSTTESFSYQPPAASFSEVSGGIFLFQSNFHHHLRLNDHRKPLHRPQLLTRQTSADYWLPVIISVSNCSTTGGIRNAVLATTLNSPVRGVDPSPRRLVPLNEFQSLQPTDVKSESIFSWTHFDGLSYCCSIWSDSAGVHQKKSKAIKKHQAWSSGHEIEARRSS
ncbi:hypothetical protein PROFUN_15453 [Planoprotostelium fungivorum]|uniref:Uncharacterized protein n=1 Tax=Planoprotostelium fungivorum TaxID=1890364 RepID=A0A2P6MW54_9EUKA|nr:hypothetical protein PROFUN_15453 [Planoprotostelium fungivorum]